MTAAGRSRWSGWYSSPTSTVRGPPCRRVGKPGHPPASSGLFGTERPPLNHQSAPGWPGPGGGPALGAVTVAGSPAVARLLTLTDPPRPRDAGPADPPTDVEDALLEGDRALEAGGARAALRYPVFRRVYLAALVSNIGNWMQTVVLAAFVFNLTGSSTDVGLDDTRPARARCSCWRRSVAWRPTGSTGGPCSSW